MNMQKVINVGKFVLNGTIGTQDVENIIKIETKYSKKLANVFIYS